MDLVLKIVLVSGLVFVLVRYPGLRRLAVVGLGVLGAVLVAALPIVMFVVVGVAGFLVLMFVAAFLGRDSKHDKAIAMMAMDD